VRALEPLTQFSHGAGCGCKLGPLELAQVLSALPPVDDPRVLVGATTGDDAAVFQIGPERALVATVDFFTPIVDDPRAYGAIAAANAISDIYAMGAEPLFALSLVSFPRDLLSSGYLEPILSAGAEKLAQAGVPVIGGHSIDDPEPKFGYAVTGEVHPDRIVSHSGAQAGDLLYLTKPLCSGLVATAIKQGSCPEDLQARAIEVMAHLNQAAGRAMVHCGAHAATDVTGFGLLGHLSNLRVGADVELARVPVLPGVRSLAATGNFPSGTQRNYDALSHLVDWSDLPQTERLLLCDAQTSGGILVALPPEAGTAFESALGDSPFPAVRIGVVTDGPLRIVA